jgi:hypothetical protein
MLIALLVYLGLGVTAGLILAVRTRFSRWLIKTGQKSPTEPNKDDLVYLIALSMAIPVVNLIWVYLVATWAYEEYIRPRLA